MLSFVVLGLAAAASAATINVTVGDGGFVYKPNNFKAQKGDIVSFTFVGGAHSVSQSGGVDNPCVQLPDGFDSNFAPATNGSQVWELKIDDDTKPIWFYCKQGTHCQQGMAGVINAASDDLINTYIANAKKLTTVQQTPSLALTGVGASATKAPAPAAGGDSTAPPADGSSAPPSNPGTATPPGSSNTPDGAAFSQSAVSAGAVAFALVGAAMFL